MKILAALVSALVAGSAGAQVTVQEHPLPPRVGAHGVWADPATQKFESFRSTTSTANVRQIHGRKGEVWTPESAADKLVVYRYK
jgi:hypothetical protein